MSLVLEVLAWILMSSGALVLLITAWGVLRLPDYYSRIHAASITDTLGAALVLLGLLVQVGLGLVTVKLLLVLAFLLVTGPMASHALAKTAQLHDIALPPERPQGDRPSLS